jgi:hypothetical protein
MNKTNPVAILFRMLRLAYALLIVVSLACSTATAGQKALQTPLTVQIADPAGAPIPGALIEVRSTESTCAWIVKSGSDGRAVTNVFPGSYELTVIMQGFATAKQRIEVQSEGQVINIVLKVGSCSGCVEVVQGVSNVQPAVTIKIVDKRGRPIPGALARLDEVNGISNARGLALLWGLMAPGNHELTVIGEGFRTAKRHLVMEKTPQKLKIILKPGDDCLKPMPIETAVRPQ